MTKQLYKRIPLEDIGGYWCVLLWSGHPKCHFYSGSFPYCHTVHVRPSSCHNPGPPGGWLVPMARNSQANGRLRSCREMASALVGTFRRVGMTHVKKLSGRLSEWVPVFFEGLAIAFRFQCSRGFRISNLGPKSCLLSRWVKAQHQCVGLRNRKYVLYTYIPLIYWIGSHWYFHPT